MRNVLCSKKVLLSLVGIGCVLVLALTGKDPELVKWLGGFVTGIVASFSVAQGLADGLSRGATSASRGGPCTTREAKTEGK